MELGQNPTWIDWHQESGGLEQNWDHECGSWTKIVSKTLGQTLAKWQDLSSYGIKTGPTPRHWTDWDITNTQAQFGLGHNQCSCRTVKKKKTIIWVWKELWQNLHLDSLGIGQDQTLAVMELRLSQYPGSYGTNTLSVIGLGQYQIETM